MPEAFDTGPLSWVKDEIDQSLEKVLASLKSVSEQPAEVASLRFAIPHLYQVSGALDMVGLEGCKRYCADIERLTARLEKQTLPVSPALMADLIAAVEILLQYLQDLLNGAPDNPIKLYPSLKPLLEAMEEPLDESDLFYPNIDVSAPKDLASNLIEESAVPIFISEQRAVFQRSLVDWLRTKGEEALAAMRQAIHKVQQVQSKAQSRTLWWVAVAFVDGLSQSKISENNGAKKLCRKLDRQLGNMALGDTKAPTQLLRDLLYYIALSDRDTATIGRVKELFELDEFFPAIASADITHATSDAETAAIGQLYADLPSLKDLWASLGHQNVESLAGYLVAFISKLDHNLGDLQKNISNVSVVNLLNAIHHVVSFFRTDNSKLNETALIEVAASLNLLEYICEHYQQIDVESQHKINTQATRLQSIIDGVPLSAAVDAFATEKLDASVVTAVAKQITAALAVIETALDAFFRNQENVEVLAEVDKPLEQIFAAFEMLEMPVPKSIAQHTARFVTFFKDNANNPDVGQLLTQNFELVAESLSMLGLYVESLPYVRQEAERALSDALLRMEQGVQAIDLQPLVSDVSIEHAPEVIIPHAGEILLTASDVNQFANIIEDTVVDTDQAVDKELQDIYLSEAEEVLASLAQNLQALRVNVTDSAALNEVRRGYHTLKGSGRTVGLTAMGEVAWAVESLLNTIIERKLFPSTAVLAFIEKVSADFSTWVVELQEHHQVNLTVQPYQSQAEKLIAELDQVAETAVAKPKKEEVLIGGTRKLSLAFFNIFLAEAQQHLQTLVAAHQNVQAGSSDLPTAESRRAAHTLASNALTAGFKPIGDLGRALEHWLDEHAGTWTAQHVALYGNVVKALEQGLEKVKELKNPRSTRALIIALSESTAAMQAAATREAEAAVIKAQKSKKSAKKSKVSQPPMVADAVQVVPELEVPVEASVLQVQGASEGVPEVVAERKDAVNDELLALFIEEARELVPQIGNDLRNWRANPNEVEYADSLQRVLHTLKGSARMAGQAEIGDTVHGMEDHVIRALRNKVLVSDFDDMFIAFDRIGYMLDDIVGGVNLPASATPDVPKTKSRHDRKSQFLRMRAEVLDRLINEAGEVSIMRSRMDREMQNFKQSSTDLTDSITRLRSYLRELEIEAETQLQSRMSLLQEANETFDPLEFDRFTRLQELTRIMAESVNDVATIQHGLLLNLDQTEAALQQQNRMNRDLQQGLMSVRMLPFATISERLQRIVRQTARELNKRVEMSIEGGNIELDRGVLDKIAAPLEHLLRNAVAHGLESTEERIKSDKPEVGHVALKVSLENDEITLVITDDGAGINLAKIRQKAIEKGIFAADQEVADQTLMTVIFEPGFTTADTVTQISGRGVGLDAVRSDVAALGGRIDVSNALGLGAMFNIYLPVTLSVAQVVLVRAGDKVFAIPSVMVEQVQKLKPADLTSAYSSHRVDWAGREYPLHFLSRLIGDFEHMAQSQIYTPVVLLRSGAYRTALHVDEVMGNQEVVMKPMGTQLTHVPGMIGATVLGDGAIILVINPVLLANREALSVGAVKVTTLAPVVEQVRKVALVVDDSLTMRKVLSRVLEREDFEVVTANDGMDAIQKLQQVSPSIILTDIEMPRMDGFEFSRYVRSNPSTAKTPLIVISSRTAEKHRNVAAEIGVDAFLGKPVQDEDLIAHVNELLK